ncbi:MAG: protein kinase domain-containing protein [Pseudomonadota bacterium]
MRAFALLLWRPLQASVALLLRGLRRVRLPADWRLLILLAAIGLLFSSLRPAWLGWLDQQLFRVGAALSSASTTPAPLEVLRLSRSEMQLLLRDPLNHPQTAALQYTLMARTGPVALLLPELPRQQPSSAEQLLQASAVQSPAHQAWQARQQLQQRFGQWLASPQVYLASEQLPPYLSTAARIASAPDNTAANGQDSSLLQRLGSAELAPHPTLAVAAGDGAFRLWPLAAGPDAMAQTLLWRHADAIYPGLLLALLDANQGRQGFQWQPPHQLIQLANERRYRLNSDGSFYPVYHRQHKPAPGVSEYTLAAFLRQPATPSLLLIGITDEPMLDAIIDSVQSLRAGHSAYAPWWSELLLQALVLILLAHAIWLMPRLSSGVRLLLSLILVMTLLASQLGLQITRGQWLPLGVAMQYLLLCTLLVSLWRRQQQPFEELQQQHLAIAVPWARHLLQQSQLEQAVAALARCPSNNDVLELLYEIGGQHERKRRPTEAAAVYRQLLQRKRRFRDVSKRLKLLEQPQALAKTTLIPSLSKTVVITDSHSAPQFGRYQVESELGRGAMGVAYLGFDPKIGRRVAIKTLDYSRYEGDELAAVKMRFFREAEAAGRLRHPNIVSVHDVGEDHDLAYIAMDYVEGQPLSDFTGKKSLLPASEVLTICAEVADALHYAHKEGIVHRDIKPSNILYDRSQRKVTVTDFGIARIVGEHSTQTGEILGSPLYMSPEQIVGKKVDRGSDIFSLGVTLYQLLSGELPFKGDNIAELSRHILQSKPANIRDLCPGLSAAVRRIINKTLQKEPGDRYRDAAELASALRQAQ